MALGNVQLTPQLVQAVRDAVDIVDIAGEMTSLQQKGNRFHGLCPFHKEKTPSFSVDSTQGLYYCFGCGAGGDAIKLFMQASGDDFPAAIEVLARRYGVPLPSAPTGRRASAQPDPRAVLEAGATWFEEQLRRHPLPRRYLEERRIPDDLVAAYRLGYAPDGWRNLLTALRDRLPPRDLEAAGLVGLSAERGEHYDRFRHRLMFPIQSVAGRIVGFGGRTLGDDKAKYVNTPETEWFHKGQLLYGFHQAKKVLREGGRALLVEGYFDVLGAAAAGIHWAVAGMGTALTAEQGKLLARYCDEVVVAYDGDEAGERAFRKALPALLAAGLAVRRARFPAGHDPDSLRLAEGPEALVAAVEDAEDAVRAEIDRLTPAAVARDPHARGAAAGAVAEILLSIRDGIVRYGYGQRAAERLSLPLDLLWKRVGGGGERGGEATPSPATPGASRSSGVRNEEDRTLALLLGGEVPVPPLEDLPPPEVFLDEEARNIYLAFRDLYRHGGRPPEVREVLARLHGAGHPLDRAAKLLVEDSVSGVSDGHDGGVAGDALGASLERLRTRWRKQRHEELVRQIRDAERDGDRDRLEELLDQKTALTRTLHPDMTGNLW